MARVTPVEVVPAENMRDQIVHELREQLRNDLAAAKKALREELLSELGHTPQGKGGSDPCGPEVVGSSTPQPSLDSDTDEVSLEASLWMMPLFIGCGVFGSGADWLLAVLLVLNVAVQYGFAFIVAFTMIQPFDETYVVELLSWRRTTAHDATFYNPILKQSLAKRVCSNDYSLIYGSGQRDLYQDLSTYLGKEGDGSLLSGATGPIMCALSLLAFILVIAREANATVRICAAVLALPRGAASTIALDSGGVLSCERLSYSRLGCFLASMALRLGVCVLLLLWGCEFLVHTISIEELLL